MRKGLGYTVFRYKNGSVRFIWKFILLYLAVYLFVFLAAVPLQLLHLTNNTYAVFLITELAVILAVLLLTRLLKNWGDGGLNFNEGWIGSFGVGFAVALVAVSFIFIINLASGQIVVSKVNTAQWLPIVWRGAILFLAVGFAEEAMYRGFAVKSLLEGYGHLTAAVVSALIFAAMHFVNPNFSWLAFINTFIVGVILALVYIRSSSLWWPIGFHTSWNLFIGVIYGLPVSGLLVKPLTQTILKKENILNGGRYGPEGGLLVTGVLLVIFIWQYLKYRNKEV